MLPVILTDTLFSVTKKLVLLLLNEAYGQISHFGELYGLVDSNIQYDSAEG